MTDAGAVSTRFPYLHTKIEWKLKTKMDYSIALNIFLNDIIWWCRWRRGVCSIKGQGLQDSLYFEWYNIYIMLCHIRLRGLLVRPGLVRSRNHHTELLIHKLPSSITSQVCCYFICPHISITFCGSWFLHATRTFDDWLHVVTVCTQCSCSHQVQDSQSLKNGFYSESILKFFESRSVFWHPG